MNVPEKLEELLKAAEAGYAQDLRDFAIPLARTVLAQHKALAYSSPCHKDDCSKTYGIHMHRGVDCDEIHPCDCGRPQEYQAALDLSELREAMEEVG